MFNFSSLVNLSLVPWVTTSFFAKDDLDKKITIGKMGDSWTVHGAETLKEAKLDQWSQKTSKIL